MQNRIRLFVDNEIKQYSFSNRKEVVDEITSNLTERYLELIASGLSEEEAYKETISLTGSFAISMLNDITNNPLRWYKKNLLILSVVVLTGTIFMFFFSPLGYILLTFAFIYFTFELSKLEENDRQKDNVEPEESKHVRSKLIIDMLRYCMGLLIFSFTIIVWDLLFRLLLDIKSISIIDWLTKVSPLWFVIIIFIFIMLIGTLVIGYPLSLIIIKRKLLSNDQMSKMNINKPKSKIMSEQIKKTTYSFGRTISIFLTLIFVFALILISNVQVYELIPSIDFQGDLVLIDSTHFWVYLLEGRFYQAMTPIYIAFMGSFTVGIYLLCTKNFSLKFWFSLYGFVILSLVLSQILLLFLSENRTSLLIPLIVTIIGFMYSLMHTKFLGVIERIVYER
jgi:hypothetical protein